MRTLIEYQSQGGRASIAWTTDPPGKPATMDHEVLDQLDQIIERIERDSTLRSVVMLSESEKYFVVGANINVLATLDERTIGPWVEKGHAVLNRLEALPVPVIAAVNGYCLGGGLELAMACDIIVATRTARFGSPEARLGLVPGWGGSYRLPRRVGLAQAQLLMFTARTIEAQEAYRIGLADLLVDDAEAMDAAIAQLAEEIAACSRTSLSCIKAMTRHEVSLSTAAQSEVAASQQCMRDHDTQQRVAQFLASKAGLRRS
ncbi:MAG: enoyl-CoA hydratase/isomerase family protein [Phycisphaeraceae bacterium]|nr:enoyl-CoA hydratase/isomerase family protein [Phycisphaeraceae bacterium]